MALARFLRSTERNLQPISHVMDEHASLLFFFIFFLHERALLLFFLKVSYPPVCRSVAMLLAWGPNMATTLRAFHAEHSL